MDLNNFDFSEAGARACQLTHPGTGEPLVGDNGPVVIHVFGADSNEFQKAVNREGNKNLQRPKAKQTMEKIRSTSAKLMAELTTGWENIVVDGEELPFTASNAEMLYQRFNWIKEQVDEFVSERQNFLPNA